jgi:hypothetical protein
MLALRATNTQNSMLQAGLLPPLKVQQAPIPAQGFTNVDTALGKLEARINEIAVRQNDINLDNEDINSILQERDRALSEAQDETIDQHE